MSIIQGHAKSASRGFYPKTIEQSLRFNDNDSAYLTYTPAESGSRTTWTWSCWVKKTSFDFVDRAIFGAGSAATNGSWLRWHDGGGLQYLHYDSNTVNVNKISTKLFRDPSSWYHIVVAYDSNNATAEDRVKMWVNGERITDWTTSTNASSGKASDLNDSGRSMFIGTRYNSNYLDGYLAEVHFTDGTAYDADAFGEFKEGVWVAKTPDVTYGTNGFYLDFQDDTEVEAFNTVLWRGDGSSSRSITGMGFAPDLVWTKIRSGTTKSHQLTDTVRGASAGYLASDVTNAEAYESDRLQSFDSDGFTIGSDNAYNGSGYTYVAWGWKAGDSNVSNTDGSITSTVRANDTYGFSIVSWTGNGSTNQSVGHGLSSAPSLMFHKKRDASGSWYVTGSLLGTDGYMFLDTTEAQLSASGYFPSPTSSVFYVSGTNSGSLNNSNDYISYCWAEKSGYSKFGSYTGTGATGNAVTTGFKPAWLLVKKTSGTQSWFVVDNTRETNDSAVKTLELSPNLSDAEPTYGSGAVATFTSNGFELAVGNLNTSGETYIYAAFADTREAAFWLDQSGNDNDWQPVNLDHNDTVADSPTNNFATFNPLAIAKYNATGFRTLGTFSDGNLTLTTNADNESGTVTFGASSGKYYMEFTSVSLAQRQQIIVYSTDDYRSDTGAVTTSSDGGGNATDRVSWTTGDVIGIAVDVDNNKVWFHKNGDWFGTSDPSTPTGGDTLAAFTGVGVRQDSGSTGNAIISFNAGQQPFKYDPPE